MRLPPEVDVVNSDEVFDELSAALAPGVDTVVVDMTATSFCDSSGVHAIMRAYEAAAARDIAMRVAAAPGGSVYRVLQLVGVGRLVAVYPSLEEALKA
ncbi:MAG TPA: STAS domain-containing protein [Trebonia sp.]|nr:STAS domain-containing protein [Trebonia sp.]